MTRLFCNGLFQYGFGAGEIVVSPFDRSERDGAGQILRKLRHRLFQSFLGSILVTQFVFGLGQGTENFCAALAGLE